MIDGAGRYDNIHGDEDECHGNCGLCEDCERACDERCDSDYEAWRDEELLAW